MTAFWIKLIVSHEAGSADLLSHFLNSRGAEGLEEKSGEITAWFSSGKWQPGLTEELSREIPGTACTVTEIPDENWMENWKESFKPFRVSPNLVIAPDWVKMAEPEKEIVLYIAPKMAFGTGHHETTQLLLTWLNEMDLTGQRVLDAGTGSGILAILAARRGATGVIGFDNDPLATENARENEDLNPVQGKITWVTGLLSDIAAGPFDLIVANINRNILLDLSASWQPLSHQQTRLFLSGLLLEDEPVIREVYSSNGWRFVEARHLGEWAALYFEKEQS